MSGVEQIPRTDGRGPQHVRINIDNISGGWNTRTYPHLLPENKLAVADNVVYYRDGLVSKRPGNAAYGGNGVTGSTVAGLSGYRFYSGSPGTITGTLLTQSGGSLYKGNDGTGVFTSIAAGYSTTQPAWYTQMFDPDFVGGASTAVFICDGSRVPRQWNGTTEQAVQTGGSFLPLGRGGSPITPKFCKAWGWHMVYAGEPTEPGGLYISDATRPQKFTGTNYTDTSGSSYIAYFPGGRDSQLGDITGIAVVGAYLIIFFRSAIYTCFNTGSYGGFQYVFNRVAGPRGCTSSKSIVEYDKWVVFYGGDGFYATDGQYFYQLPDEIPTVYKNSAASSRPPEIKNPTTVVGVRRQSQYWASYDFDNSGIQKRIVIFDFSANGGWLPNQPGGAWARWPTGMQLSWGIECNGPGDTFQLFWGRSDTDLVAQHDTGVYSDFGAAITMEVRLKAFFLDRPVSPKTLLKVWPILVFDGGVAFSTLVNVYVILDQSKAIIPPIAEVGGSTPGQWGTGTWGTMIWSASSDAFSLLSGSVSPPYGTIGTSIEPGMMESSTTAINLLGFSLEVVIDEPNT